MLIVCPTCGSQYAIEPRSLGASGRIVRCANCREAWFVAGPAASASEPTLPVSAPVIIPPEGSRRASTRRAPARTATPSPKPAERFAAAATLGLALVAAAAVLGREKLVRVAPESAAVFAALGLPVNLVGLALSDVSSELVPGESGGPARILVVRGDIRNGTGAARPVPALRLNVEGDAGDVLYSWQEPPMPAELAPGASQPFRARLAAPPPDGRRVVVTFSGPSERAVVASR